MARGKRRPKPMTSFVGDIEIGGGEIKFNLPLTNKRLVLNMTDLETFKEMLITKD